MFTIGRGTFYHHIEVCVVCACVCVRVCVYVCMRVCGNGMTHNLKFSIGFFGALCHRSLTAHGLHGLVLSWFGGWGGGWGGEWGGGSAFCSWVKLRLGGRHQRL